MKDFNESHVHTNDVAFPDTKAINETVEFAQDGTEWVKVGIDDRWGAAQALMREAGLTPSGSDEVATNSQRLEAIKFLVNNGPVNARSTNGVDWVYNTAGEAFRFYFDFAAKKWSAQHAVSGAADAAITWLGPVFSIDAKTGAFSEPIITTDTTEATSKDTGSIVTEGGIGVEKKLNVGDTITAGSAIVSLSTIESTSKDTGSIVTEGGIGVEKKLNVGDTITAGSAIESQGGDFKIATGFALRHNGTPVAGYLEDGTPYFIKDISDITLGVGVTSNTGSHGISNAWTNDRILKVEWRFDQVVDRYLQKTDDTSDSSLVAIGWTNTDVNLSRIVSTNARTFKVRIWYK